MKKNFFLVLMACLFILSSCNTGSGSEDFADKIEVDYVGWYFLNLDTEFQNLIWINDPYVSTCYLDFALWYEGEAIQSEDLVSFTAEYDGNTFNVPINQDLYIESSSDSNRHGLNGYYWWNVGSGEDYIPLGPWIFTVTFADGSETVFTTTFNKPGSTDVPAADSYIITEDLTADSTHFQMVKRAEISAAVYDTNELTVSFASPGNDDQVRSGWVRIYDNEGNYVGYSERFIDNSGAVNSGLSGGFSADGSTNSFTVNLSTELSAEVSESGNYYAVVLLVDGKQYGNGAYDCRSYSEPFSFSIP